MSGVVKVKLDEVYENFSSPHLSWQVLEGNQYNLEYTTIPFFYLAKIRAKSLIKGVNPCLESDVYIFKNLEEAEKFFEDLTGYPLR